MPVACAELLRELAEAVLAREVAAGRGDLVAQHLGEGEVLEERDEIRERLVEGEHVGVARLVEAAVDAVEQRVCHLVRDDVVAEAGEDVERCRAGSFRPHRRGEVAEQERLLRRAVVRVRLSQRVRIDAQPRHVLLGELPVDLVAMRRPEREPSERPFEVPDRPHRDGVDHLLVELRVALRRRQAVLRDDRRVVQVDRLVEGAAGGIVVDHLDVLAHRAGGEDVLPFVVAFPRESRASPR